jgi:hypothetical protein
MKIKLDWLFLIDLANPDGHSDRTLRVRTSWGKRGNCYVGIRLFSWKHPFRFGSWRARLMYHFERWMGRRWVWPEW